MLFTEAAFIMQLASYVDALIIFSFSFSLLKAAGRSLGTEI